MTWLGDLVSKLLTGTTASSRCNHFDNMGQFDDYIDGCEDCLRVGDTWVHLRRCLICGFVGCCDNSRNQHATRHFGATSHSVMRSVEPGETWGWCFIDKRVVPDVMDLPVQE